jgi:hypothetical protein
LIFWISYSAFQRGTSPEARRILLELVASKNDVQGPKWLQNNSIEFQLWDSEYAAILDNYDSKFTKYANKWLESDAGKKFSEVVTKNRFKVYN